MGGLPKAGSMKRGSAGQARPDAPAEVLLNVKVVPGSSRDRLAGRYGDGIKVQVSAPPEGGKANQAVCQLLAKTLGRPMAAIQIVRGQNQARKVVKIAGMAASEVDSRLATTK